MEALRIMVINAIEAMSSGGSLKIVTEKKDYDIVISISDTGKGISQDDLPFIFDPFFSTKASGVGMNLAKAKKIITDHGGYITVESKTGKGTTFNVSVPIKNNPPNT
jgi:signal transduction histidine kinase